MLSGQGSQHPGMGAQLHQTYPAYAHALDNACAALDPHLDTPLRDVMFAQPGTEKAALLETTLYTQPALFAHHVAGYRLLTASGVTPHALIGHSIGELSAAHLAGTLPLDLAAHIVTTRAKLLHTLPTGTGMLAALSGAAPLAEHLQRHPTVEIAAHNSPTATTLAGPRNALHTLAQELTAAGIRTRPLNVTHAFHHAHTDPILNTFTHHLTQLFTRHTLNTPDIPVISNITGTPATTDQHHNPAYWAEHIRQPVRFHQGLTHLAENEHITLYTELGPHPTLTPHLPPGTHTTPHHTDEIHTHLATLTTLHTHHHTINLTPHLPTGPQHHLDLPTYPFQHHPYWLQAPTQLTDATDLGLAGSPHPLLAATVQLADTRGAAAAAESSGASTVFTGRIGLSTHPWLADHAVAGTVLLPGTALVDLALHAGDHTGATHLDELTLHAPLVLDEAISRDLQVTTTPETDGWRITIHSRPHTNHQDDTEPWICHATGTLTTAEQSAQPLTQWPPANTTPVGIADLYAHLAATGYEYGPAFQGVTTMWEQADGTLHAEISLPEQADPAGHTIHPALLDAALHPLAARALQTDTSGELRLPFAWTGVGLHATGATHLRVTLTTTGNDVSVQAWDPTGAPVATVTALATRPVDPTALATGMGSDTRNSFFHLTWKTAEATTGAVGLDEVDIHVPGIDAGGEGPAAAHAATEALLTHLQSWLAANETIDRRLVILTQHAVATSPAEEINLTQAPLWGLVRTAQNENPGRIHLVDTDDPADTSHIAAAIATGEPQLAIRHDQFLAPRLTRSTDRVEGQLTIPADPNWRLDKTAPGTLDNLALLPNPDLPEELAPGQVRIDVRAIGLNFRDVLITLGMYPGDALLASEGAGIVTEVADDVTSLTVGDRVMGMFPLGVGAQTVTDHRLVAAIPAGWDFTTAAGVPVAFLTAYYALFDLARLQPGETLLLHAATGGVGSAALQLAQHTGADIYATAHPTKHHLLTAQGLDPTHIASSRTLDFENHFRTHTPNHGIDVVLNALAHQHTDASLRLLHPGGRFIEMGKTDIRDATHITQQHQAHYQNFDLIEAGPNRIQEILTHLTELFEADTLTPLPTTCFDIRHTPHALRHLSQARHTGKLILTLPQPLNPNGTILITGGTGGLATLTAHHLITHHHTQHLLLASRTAPQHTQLQAELSALGAHVTLTACDTTNPSAVPEPDRLHPRRTPAHRRHPHRRHTRRHHPHQPHPRPPPPRPRTQNRRRLEPPPRHPTPQPHRLHPLLLRSRHPRQPRTSQLRRRQHLPRRPRPPPPPPRTTRHQPRLGLLETHHQPHPPPHPKRPRPQQHRPHHRTGSAAPRCRPQQPVRISPVRAAECVHVPYHGQCALPPARPRSPLTPPCGAGDSP